jgi:hypothetical protein
VATEAALAGTLLYFGHQRVVTPSSRDDGHLRLCQSGSIVDGSAIFSAAAGYATLGR